MLRGLQHPARLRRNALGAALLDRPGHTPQVIRAAVDGALERLTPRQRAIVERCDFGAELHEDVARSLAISERHFYRERSKALGLVRSCLMALQDEPALPKRAAPGVWSPDAFAVALDHAGALLQAGRGELAATALERTLASATLPEQQVLLCCRLAELHSDAGRVSQASEWGVRAGAFAASDDARVPWLEDEAAISQAHAMRLAGDELAAEALATRALVRLRAATVKTPSPRVSEAFASAAMLVAERAVEAGSRESAARVCAEAKALLEADERSRELTRLRLEAKLAFTKLFSPGDVDEATATLSALLVRQLRAGFLADASQTATTLAATHRVLNRPRAAGATLLPMLDVARNAASGEVLAGMLLEYAWSLVPPENGEAVWKAIAQVRLHGAARTLVHALSFSVEAAALLARSCPERALRAAHVAIETLSPLRRWRYVGAALRLQALALEALGDLDAARSTISASLERLESSANPVSVARARADAARLS